MEFAKFRISKHAARRMAQRNLSVGDVALTLRYGRREHRAGAEFYVLTKRGIPEGMGRALERLVGATVVVSGGEIVTVYRNRRALASIRKKAKRLQPATRWALGGVVPWQPSI
jgi:hypothetical protein